MKKLLAFVCSTVVLFCTEMSYAMPSQAELDNVQPLVNELMGPLVKDFKAKIWVKGSDTSVYVLLYMLDGGESAVTGSAAGCVADLV